jgi:hypothetical protein
MPGEMSDKAARGDQKDRGSDGWYTIIDVKAGAFDDTARVYDGVQDTIDRGVVHRRRNVDHDYMHSRIISKISSITFNSTISLVRCFRYQCSSTYHHIACIISRGNVRCGIH